ncbi:keratin, type I cytoskeletal 14-like [Palaemon carinicauda]|uniref:keratin, type I cytoskeletal 14-like n=1 Tax=Palaemon carinicauda TaxID=392227 RepID=UPI0035B675B1
MNFLRPIFVVAIVMALVCSISAFPDPSGGYGGLGGFGGGIGHGLGGGFGHGLSTVSVVRPVVTRVVGVSSGIGHGGFGGIGGGYGW